MTKQSPVNGSEPLMRLDFTSARTRSYAFMLILDQQLLDCGFAQATHQSNLLDLDENLDSPGNWDRLCKHDIVLEHIRKRSIPISALEGCRCELDVSHGALTPLRENRTIIS